ncbi:MAG TPA: efflux RND transporter periplasmic adaptor subunit [Candidatus Polarisedimenticolaceae bacterium]|nr:efflux RND transporter periplasmic adaptor subunit [Candidatus Polarisedimenticolaceae bacterium]
MRALPAGAICAALSFLGCGKEAVPPPAAALPPATVRVQRIEARPHAATEDVVGTVRAKLRAVLEAKISGRIDRMTAVPGQTVRRGTLLARIEAREVQARVDQARAVRQQTEDDLRRALSLSRQNILPQSELDAAQARARVAEAAVQEAETLLGYTAIEAPFDGTVTRKYADVGDLAAPGKPLLEMEDGRALRLEADVPEAVVGTLALGNVLPVRVDALSAELRGTVAEISPAGDPGSRTFLVRLDLPPTPGLRAGQFGRVTLPVGETTALRVPASAVVQRGQMEIVFVVEDGKARLRLVRTGRRFGDEVELVSGMEGGETLVVEGGSLLLDGQPLQIR